MFLFKKKIIFHYIKIYICIIKCNYNFNLKIKYWNCIFFFLLLEYNSFIFIHEKKLNINNGKFINNICILTLNENSCNIKR